jgi:drug/metabolite transporter (DMT)-like permease
VNHFQSALVKAAIATVLFGSVPACVRLVKLDSVALGIARLSLAAVGMSAIMVLVRRSSWAAFRAEVRREWLVLVAVGVSFGFHWLFYFLSIKHASAAIGTLGFCTYGAQLPLLGWACGFGRPTAAEGLGIVLALVGTWLCLPAEGWQGADGWGLLIGVLSGTAYAVLPLLHQRHARMDHEIRTWAQFLFALPVFLPLAGQAQWSWTGRDMLLVLHMGLLVTLVGHYLWVQVTTELPIQVTSVISYLQMPVTLAMNYLLIGEQLSGRMMAGAGLIVAANALALGVRSRVAEETPGE